MSLMSLTFAFFDTYIEDAENELNIYLGLGWTIKSIDWCSNCVVFMLSK